MIAATGYPTSRYYVVFGQGRPLVVLADWPDDWRVPADYHGAALPRSPGRIRPCPNLKIERALPSATQ